MNRVDNTKAWGWTAEWSTWGIRRSSRKTGDSSKNVTVNWGQSLGCLVVSLTLADSYYLLLCAQLQLTFFDSRQAPLSMEFSRQQYWSGLPFPTPGTLPDLVIKSMSPALQADSLPLTSSGKPISYTDQCSFSPTLLMSLCLSLYFFWILFFGHAAWHIGS